MKNYSEIYTIFIKKKLYLYLLLFFIIILLYKLWFRGGFESVGLSYDFGRDLSEISNIYIGRTVWLGPQLIGNFPVSSIYYYLFYPFLWLSGGNGNSIIFANLLFASILLGVFGILSIKESGGIGLIMTALVGLSPWWQLNALTPGNGSTYVLWLFSAIMSLWFKGPLFLSALLCGLAIAYHPAAIFILPILVYEYWNQKSKFKSFLLLLIGLVIPSLPTILFEIITKGYLIRSWISHPSAGLLRIDKYINISNIIQIGVISGINFFFIILLFIMCLFVKKREKFWFYISFLPLGLFCFFSPLATRYLLGIVCIIWFIFLVFYSKTKWGKIILISILIFYFGRYIIFSNPPTQASRNIPRMSSIVNTLINKQVINKNKKIAVVEAIDKDASVAAADDYRFLLRMKNFNILNVQQYNEAESLIMFIEEPKFNWKKWSTWEIEQSNCKNLTHELSINGIKIIVFNK